jgi:uncharacterized membrane protein
MAAALIALVTAFVGSAVETVEAVTVLLAVGLTRGWRSAVQGAAAATAILVVLIATVGGLVLSHVPETALKLAVGTLVMLFGLRWLRKAVLRAAGALAKHDEQGAFDSARRALGTGSTRRFDRLGFLTAFNAVLLEGTEVAFIVVAASGGGTRSLLLASAGGVLAVIVVVALAIVVRKPLEQVPENTLKYVVGIVLVSLGTFWAVEGMGVRWPLDIVSMAPLAVIYTAASLAAVALIAPGARRRAAAGAA